VSAVQRIRLTFSRGEEAKYTSHLDLARQWERAVRRAGLPLAYSQGFTPHARISFAAPLAVGLTAEGEMVDLFLAEELPPETVRERLGAQMPPGLVLLAATAVEPAAPSLQASVCAAAYEVWFDERVPGLAEAVEALLARESVPYERKREKRTKAIDLRPFIETLVALEDDGRSGLDMRLRLDTAGSVRPDEVLGALGLGGRPVRLRRTRLFLAE
jgi:radical SAM-linked protein